MPDKLLVFGSTGQVARELAQLAPDAVFLSREDADLTRPEACTDAIRCHAPRAIINAAAYTAVDKAEQEKELAGLINAQAPAAMARAASEMECPLVHISTDYVFDGQGQTPWSPEDAPNPQNVYGQTKLDGEQAVTDAGVAHAILRTSWVFSPYGNNFLKTMLRLSETRNQLSVVEDQIGGPTPARAIAETCLIMAEQLRQDPSKSGVYHFSGAPEASWKEFARTIFGAAGREVAVTGIPTSDYPTPAKRPLNSRLDCEKTCATFGVSLPDWKAATQDIVAGLLQQDHT